MSIRSSCSSLTNYWEKCMEIPDYNCWFFYFSFQAYQILLHLFWNSFIGCINCYDVLLLNWHQYHHEMTFFIPGNLLCSDINFVWYYYRYPNFLFMIITMVNLFPSLCVFIVKRVLFCFLQAIYSWILLFHPISQSLPF